ncbi:MAG: RagB/SusD family nutrient uptake outer membrane protein [Chitinophaga sp.]|uniref:RagB/SusD family nutrient uptake outer membrane protein n=1 Tax=Chitinophaga sp. TaxID=1869181 RepID=UPI001B0519A3|nr:RagB/SusD family nutrient uptake outer membrane protein [Chitinophaga sp.]MBO9732843.1 RagB/SusD family nutrient uptake outer membrane protein [Chitinophaga sp.]
MKQHTLLHIAAIVTIGLSACSKQLDDVAPNTKIAFSQLTKNNLPLVINGAKLALTNNNAFYTYYALQDVMSDDFQSLGFTAYENNNIPSNDNTLVPAYRQPYQCIANANMVIQYATQFSGDSTVNTALGEAFLLRGFSYMLLSECFGDVVIIKGDENPKSRPPRNPATEVNQFIESDLKNAIDHLPAYTNAVSGSKQSAQLLLARFYLNHGRYDEALSMANAVISSGKFSLQSNFGDIFKSSVNSPEAIYKINETSTSTFYGLPNIYGQGGGTNSGQAGSGNTWADSNLVKSYEPADIRRSYFARTKGGAIVDTVYFITKFPQELTPSYVVCRYSEAFLIVAEANARKGTVDVTTYNQLRSARNASTVNNTDFATPAAFLSVIEQERRREFIGERLRWSDMQRFGKMNTWLQSFGQPVTHVLMPIPSREFFINDNLVQNADYSR